MRHFEEQFRNCSDFSEKTSETTILIFELISMMKTLILTNAAWTKCETNRLLFLSSLHSIFSLCCFLTKKTNFDDDLKFVFPIKFPKKLTSKLWKIWKFNYWKPILRCDFLKIRFFKISWLVVIINISSQPVHNFPRWKYFDAHQLSWIFQKIRYFNDGYNHEFEKLRSGSRYLEFVNLITRKVSLKEIRVRRSFIICKANRRALRSNNAVHTDQPKLMKP